MRTIYPTLAAIILAGCAANPHTDTRSIQELDAAYDQTVKECAGKHPDSHGDMQRCLREDTINTFTAKQMPRIAATRLALMAIVLGDKVDDGEISPEEMELQVLTALDEIQRQMEIARARETELSRAAWNEIFDNFEAPSTTVCNETTAGANCTTY